MSYRTMGSPTIRACGGSKDEGSSCHEDVELYCFESCKLKFEGSAPDDLRSSDVHTRRMPTQVFEAKYMLRKAFQTISEQGTGYGSRITCTVHGNVKCLWVQRGDLLIRVSIIRGFSQPTS